jgi:radical SAM protein with 4Fe4S-binding SPASM domain
MYVLSLPAIYALELTTACNNLCPGCSNICKTNRAQLPLTAATWERLLAQFGQHAVQIRLTGGEPTLHPEFLRILAAATSYQAWVTIFTNARWRHPQPFVQSIRAWPRLSGLLVSLHGAQAKTHEAFSRVRGSFDETLANIRLAVSNGISVALSTVITRWNIDRLEEMLELRRNLGARQVVFNRFLGPASPELEAELPALQRAIQRIESWARAGEPVKYGIGVPQCFEVNSSVGCLAGVAYVTLDASGSLRPCSHSPSVIGSLQSKPLEALWHSQSMNNWRALMPDECTCCAAYPVCHGGCRAALELRVDRRDPLRRAPLGEYMIAPAVRELPTNARPRMKATLRPETFGYAVIGEGHVLPVRAEARPVIDACDGTFTFAQLAEQFGQSGLNLLGELWGQGMLDILP